MYIYIYIYIYISTKRAVVPRQFVFRHPAHRRSLRYRPLAPFPLHCMVSAPSPHRRSDAKSPHAVLPLAPSPLHRRVWHRRHVGARPGLNIRRTYLHITRLHLRVRLLRRAATGARTHRRSLRYCLPVPSRLDLTHRLRCHAGARPGLPPHIHTYIYVYRHIHIYIHMYTYIYIYILLIPALNTRWTPAGRFPSSRAPTLPAVWSPSSASTTLYGFRSVATPALGRKDAPRGISP